MTITNSNFARRLLLKLWLAAGDSSVNQDTYALSRDGEVLVYLFHHFYFQQSSRVQSMDVESLELLLKLMDNLLVWRNDTSEVFYFKYFIFLYKYYTYYVLYNILYINFILKM